MALKVLTVFGTRPEAVKMAPVVAEMSRRRGVEGRVCVTAQHRELLDQVLRVFPMRVDHDLDLMQPGQTLNGLVSRALPALDKVLEAEQPDVVLVQGDTTTAFVAALAAFHRGIRVGHVEAGLRTFDARNPFPEEANRRFVDAMSDLWFPPTRGARANLLAEGYPASRVHVTGNTSVDALQAMLRHLRRPAVDRELRERASSTVGELGAHRLVMVTGHRRESFGQGLRELCGALADIVDRNPDVVVVYPVHPNPNVQGPVTAALGGRPGIRLVPPLDYPLFLFLLSHAYVALTDSGGVQEEAPSLRVPVLVTRRATERPEAVEAGAARVVGLERKVIARSVQRLLDRPHEHRRMQIRKNPFGDGKAAPRIVDHLLKTRAKVWRTTT